MNDVIHNHASATIGHNPQTMPSTIRHHEQSNDIHSHPILVCSTMNIANQAPKDSFSEKWCFGIFLISFNSEIDILVQ